MKPIEDMLRLVMPRTPGAAEPLAIDCLRRAAEEFCVRTRTWRYEDEFPVTGDEDEVLCAPAGAVIHQIESARFDGDDLRPVSLDWLDKHVFGWRDLDHGQASYITQAQPNTVILVPRGGGTLSLSLFLKPALDADYLPDWMIAQHARLLADGAIGELMMIPGNSFTNPNIAAAYMQRFNAGIDTLSTRNIRGQQRAPVRTRPSWF